MPEAVYFPLANKKKQNEYLIFFMFDKLKLTQINDLSFPSTSIKILFLLFALQNEK